LPIFSVNRWLGHGKTQPRLGHKSNPYIELKEGRKKKGARFYIHLVNDSLPWDVISALAHFTLTKNAT
jgi:hypothetical protein